MFPSFPYRDIFSSVSFCFQDANYAYATRQGILTKIRAREHLQKFCEREQESTSNSSKGQIFASTFKLDRTIRYPSIKSGWNNFFTFPLFLLRKNSRWVYHSMLNISLEIYIWHKSIWEVKGIGTDFTISWCIFKQIIPYKETPLT